MIAVAAAVWAWWVGRAGLLVAVAAAFLAGGAALASRTWDEATHPDLRRLFDHVAGAEDSIFTTLEGVLTRDASLSQAGISLALDVDALAWAGRVERTSGGVALTVVGAIGVQRIQEFRGGRRVRIAATLRRPATYRDPDVPDRELALARQGIALVGTVKSGALVDVMAHGPPWAEAAAAGRQRVRDTVARTVAPHSTRSAAIVNAIVIGDRAGLDADVQRSLQEAGTYHVIAISGGNIAILAGVLLMGFRLAGLLGRAAMIVAAAGLVAYAYLVGGGASVDRATWMAVVYLGIRAWDHRTAPLNTIALVAALLAIANPLTIVDPAFLLTFGATLAIVIVMPAIARLRLSRWLGEPLALFTASVAAEAALLPVSAFVFSRVTFAGLVLNFLAIPLMAVAQLAGMALVPIAVVSERAAAAVGWIAHVGAAGLVWSAALVRFAPVATWRVPPPHWMAVVVYYGAIAGSCWLRGRRRIAGALVACAAGLWIAAAPWRIVTSRGDGRLHVWFVDVGQGDATVIRFPHGRTWLVDAGGLSSGSTFDVGDRVVAPVLRHLGVWRLDRLVLTHGDPDHTGGAAAIVREFRPREIWEGVPVPRYEPTVQLADEARSYRLAWRTVNEGATFDVDDVDVSVRHPPPPEWERQRVRNDDSVVLELRWSDVSIVLTGDIGRAVEGDVVKRLPPAPIRVIKAPHHGSGGSSSDALINGTRPAAVVVSVGRGNHFGHPAPDVIERYHAAGAEIFRTDQDGEICLHTDGHSVTIRTFNGRTYEPQSSRRPQNEPQSEPQSSRRPQSEPQSPRRPQSEPRSSRRPPNDPS